MAIGRISGPMLYSNLERQGVDLAFESNILYLDVTNRYIGANTDTPNAELQVVGTANIGNITLYGNSISVFNGLLDLGDVSKVAISGGAPNYVMTTDGQGNLSWNQISSLDNEFGNLRFDNNTIEVIVTDGNLTLAANGTGVITTANTVYVGNLISNGNIDAQWINGNINTSEISVSGNLAGQYLIGDYLVGTLLTNNQPYINSLGTLTDLSVSGFGNIGNLVIFDQTITGINLNADITIAPLGTGNISANGSIITNIATPVGSTDAVNKGYVDGLISGVTLSSITADDSFVTVFDDGINPGNIVVTADGTDVAWFTETLTNIQQITFINNVISTSANTLVLAPSNINDGNTIVSIGGVGAVDIPVGNTAQRPTSPNSGFFRYNTEIGSIEWYTGAEWVSGAKNIAMQIIYPDGVANTYALDEATVAQGILVSINGTLQQPNSAYTLNLAGDQIIFAEVPLVTDIIEIRYIASTVATAPWNGGAVSGNIIPTANITYDLGSSSYRWRDLWLSNSTIYLGNATISATENYVELPAGSRIGGIPISGGTYGNTEVEAFLITYTGNISAGNLSLNGGTASDIADPIAAQDAATKNYVDTQLSGISATTISNGSASVTTFDDGGTGNVIISGNTFIDALFFANGIAFTTYSNVDSRGYLASLSNVNIGIGTGINQGVQAVAIGPYAGNTSQGAHAVAIGGNGFYGNSYASEGYAAGGYNQGAWATAVGVNAGAYNQGTDATALGDSAGARNQGNEATAVGFDSGLVNQGAGAVAVGVGSGEQTQGTYSVAVGALAGANYQQELAIAIGKFAGRDSQGYRSIAIGASAGYNNQAGNSIIISANGQVDSTTSGFFVDPVRNLSSSNVLYYNTVTKEITFDVAATTYSNVDVAAYLPTYSGNVDATITASAQPYIRTLANLISFGGNFGDTTAQGNLTVVGNLTVQGNTITIGSTNLTVTDSIIDLHTPQNLGVLVSDDGRDIGFRFHYYKGSDDHAFFGWENDTETLIYLQRSDEVSSNISGTYGNVQFGSLLLSNTTAATSTTSGALQVRGGVGVGGNIFVASSGGNSIVASGTITGTANVRQNLGSSSIYWGTAFAGQFTGNGATIGGSGISSSGNLTFKATNLGVTTNSATAFVFNEIATTVKIGGAATSISIGAVGADTLTYNATTGSLIPGANAVVNLGSTTAYWGTTFTGNINANGALISGATTSTSTTTGALVVGGGVGVSGALYIQNTGDVSANIGTLFLGNLSTNANLGAYQIFANANVSSLQNQITGANTNIQSTSANLGAYQIFANANAASQQTQINNIVSQANANTAAYLPTYSGSLGGTLTTGSQPNITTVGTITSGTWNATAIDINRGGTGATSASQALTNILPTGTTAGYVLTTGGPGSFYWAAAGTGGATTGTRINTSRSFFTATSNQTLFTGIGTYTPGAGQLRVYQNGVRQFDSEYTETSSTSFTLTTGAFAGDLIMAEVDAYISYAITADSVTYNPTGAIPSSANTAQLAIDSLESRKAALTGATFTGNITISNSTISTSTTTGALIITGGVGIGGNLTINNTGDVSANIGTLRTNVNSLDANLGAYQTFANANVSSLQDQITGANTNIQTTSANLGAYQIFANANVSSLQDQITGANTNIQTTSANLGAYQTFANANVVAIQANLGAYQEYANANIATIQANIGSFYNYANTKIGTNTNSNLVVVATTTSTSTTTGALVVGGGVGIAGNTYIAGNVILATADLASNVGIGTSQPSGRLHLFSTNASQIFRTDESTSGYTYTQSLDDTGVYYRHNSNSRGFRWIQGSAVTEVMRIAHGTGNLVITASSSSTSTTTGALVVGGGAGVAGNLFVGGNVFQQTAYYEGFSNVSNTGGNLTCNLNNGAIFYTNALTANVTANFTNVNITTGYLTGVTLIVDVGASPFTVSNLQVNGTQQTIRWVGGVGGPAPNTLANNTNIISFSLIYLGPGTYRVIGQLSSFG